MAFLLGKYADYYEEIITESYDYGYIPPFDMRTYTINAFCELGPSDGQNYTRLSELYWGIMDCIDKGFMDLAKEVKSDFDRDCMYVSDIISGAIGKLKYKYPDMEDIIDLLPQNTIHGINIVLDRIIEIKREAEDSSWF